MVPTPSPTVAPFDSYNKYVSDFLNYNYLRDKNKEQQLRNITNSNQFLRELKSFYYNHKFNNYFINRDLLSNEEFDLELNKNFLSKIKKSFRSIYDSPTDIRINIMNNYNYIFIESKDLSSEKKYHNHSDSCIYKTFIDFTNLDSLILKYNDVKPTFTCLKKLINNIEKIDKRFIHSLPTNYKIIFLCDIYHKNTLKYRKYEPYNDPLTIYNFLTINVSQIKRTTDNSYLIKNVIMVKDDVNDTLKYLEDYLTNNVENLLKLLSIVNMSFVDNYLPFLMNKYLSTTRQVADIYKLLNRNIWDVFNITKINSDIYNTNFEIEKKYIRNSIVNTVDSEKFSEYYLIGENIIDEEYITEDNYSFNLRNKKYYYMYKQYKNQIKRGKSNLLDKIRDLILDKMILEKYKFINSKNQMILTGQPVATPSSSQNTIYDIEYIFNLTEADIYNPFIKFNNLSISEKNEFLSVLYNNLADISKYNKPTNNSNLYRNINYKIVEKVLQKQYPDKTLLFIDGPINILKSRSSPVGGNLIRIYFDENKRVIDICENYTRTPTHNNSRRRVYSSVFYNASCCSYYFC